MPIGLESLSNLKAIAVTVVTQQLYDATYLTALSTVIRADAPAADPVPLRPEGMAADGDAPADSSELVTAKTADKAATEREQDPVAADAGMRPVREVPAAPADDFRDDLGRGVAATSSAAVDDAHVPATAGPAECSSADVASSTSDVGNVEPAVEGSVGDVPAMSATSGAHVMESVTESDASAHEEYDAPAPAAVSAIATEEPVLSATVAVPSPASGNAPVVDELLATVAEVYSRGGGRTLSVPDLDISMPDRGLRGERGEVDIGRTGSELPSMRRNGYSRPDAPRTVEAGAVTGRSVEPASRGGGRFCMSPSPHAGAERVAESRGRRPELVCYRQGRRWSVGVELEEEAPDEDGPAAFQGSEALLPSESDGRLLIVPTFGPPVDIRRAAVGRVRVPVGAGGYELFKLCSSRGRRVNTASAGEYLAVVPDSWTRDEIFSGAALVAPEPTNVEGFRAHYFVLRPGESHGILFQAADGTPVRLDSRSAVVELVGAVCPDGNGQCGPLFVGGPPHLKAQHASFWQRVRTIVLGEEDVGRGKWRTDFAPRAEGRELALPQDLADQRSGWFFVRLYDGNDELVDSLHFRFAAGLKSIRLAKPHTVLPPSAGHPAVEVIVEHSDDARLMPRDQRPGLVRAKETDDGTAVTIPPTPECDVTHWTFRQYPGGPVHLTLAVPRLRWALGAKRPPEQWDDKPLPLRLSDCETVSDRRLWVRWPCDESMREAAVRLGSGGVREIARRRGEAYSSLELYQFADSPELRRCGTLPLRLWFDVPADAECVGGRPPEAGGPAMVAELHTVLECGRCDFTAARREDMIEHVLAVHEGDYFRYLTYEEVRERNPELLAKLPAYIHRCLHCGFVAEAGDGENPTTEISHHITKVCKKNLLPGGERDKAFVYITRTEDIRQYTRFKDLPDVTACKVCRAELRPGTADQRHEHLVGCHGSALYFHHDATEPAAQPSAG